MDVLFAAHNVNKRQRRLGWKKDYYIVSFAAQRSKVLDESEAVFCIPKKMPADLFACLATETSVVLGWFKLAKDDPSYRAAIRMAAELYKEAAKELPEGSFGVTPPTTHPLA